MGKNHRPKFVGMDVHQNTISIAFADDGPDGEVRLYGRIKNTPEAIDKVIRTLVSTGAELHFVYEAGPCGFTLYRHLTGNGFPCTVNMLPKLNELLVGHPAFQRLTGVEGCDIFHVFLAEPGRHGRHHGIVSAFPLFEILKGLHDVLGMLPGQLRPLWVGTIAVETMTPRAGGCLCLPGCGIAARDRTFSSSRMLPGQS